MAISVTRWKLADKQTMYEPTKTAIQPYFEAGQTNGIPVLLDNSVLDIPIDEYVCERFWISEELAQNWLNEVETIAQSVGCTCLEKSVRPY